jgi:hypothetical protein
MKSTFVQHGAFTECTTLESFLTLAEPQHPLLVATMTRVYQLPIEDVLRRCVHLSTYLPTHEITVFLSILASEIRGIDKRHAWTLYVPRKQEMSWETARDQSVLFTQQLTHDLSTWLKKRGLDVHLWARHRLPQEDWIWSHCFRPSQEAYSNGVWQCDQLLTPQLESIMSAPPNE